MLKNIYSNDLFNSYFSYGNINYVRIMTMVKKKESYIKKFYKHILIFIILTFAVISTINFVIDKQEDNYLNVQNEILNSSYKTNYKYYKIMSEDIYSIYKDSDIVLSTLYNANKNNDKITRAKLRDKLYNKLKKRFKRLKNMGIVQLHFHLKDNASFLRMHKIDKFGDDLTKIRKSVALTNSLKKPYDGFEVGKANHSFRFVYPLFYKTKHVGSVEVGFSTQKLMKATLLNSTFHAHFLIKKSIIENSLWETAKLNNYVQSVESPEYLLDYVSHYTPNNKNIHKIMDNSTFLTNVSKNLKTKEAFTLVTQYNKESYIGSFIPIYDIVDKEVLAYLAAYGESDYVDNLNLQKQYMQILGITVIFLLSIFGIYVTYNNDRLTNMAHFDKLTSLANRTYFHLQLEIELKRAKRYNNSLAVMFIDLDGFKQVNDLYGHSTGDDLLVKVAQRISSSVRDVDLVARLGGDEFTVVLTDIKEVEDSLLVANKIIKVLSQDFILNKKVINIGASIGISTFPQHAQDSDTLIKQSDIAMYEAKENGKNQAIIYKET